MTDSTDQGFGDISQTNDYNDCDLFSKNSIEESAISSDDKCLEDWDQKDLSHTEDLKVYCQNEQDKDKGDFHDIEEKSWPSIPRLKPTDLDDFDDKEDAQQLKASLYSKISEAIITIGSMLKDTITNVFAPTALESEKVIDDSILEYKSFSEDVNHKDCDRSNFDTEPQLVAINRCPKHGIPDEEISAEELVSQWLDKLPNVDLENEPVQAVLSISEEETSPNFNVLSMNMLQYSRKRHFGDLKVCIGKSAYLVDSCFLQAQSTKFRHILFWSLSNGRHLLNKDQYFPFLKLTDMSSIEFEALLVYMYTGGRYILPSAINTIENKPTQRFLDLLKIYGIPYVPR